MSTGPVARVLLDSALPQLDHLFDYAVPEALRDTVAVGQRVKVPFRSATRNVGGYIIELAETAEFVGQLSPLAELVSEVPVLTPEIWELARTLADRAAGSAGDIIRLAIPPRQVRVEKQFLAKRAAAHDAVAVEQPGAASATDQTVSPDSTGVNPDAPVGAPEEAAAATEPSESAPVGSGTQFVCRYHPALAALGQQPARLALGVVPEPARLSSGEWVGNWAATLAETASLLLAEGQSSILVLPDYRDLDQAMSALQTMVPTEHIVRVDAKQTNPERYRSFLSLLEPVPRVIVGNRSAVYAPAHQLGAIMLWDDGDSLHDEPLSPYVHARDAALVRAQQSAASLVFAGHTRTTEVQRLVEIGYVAECMPVKRPQPRVILSSQTVDADGLASLARIPTIAWLKAKEAAAKGPVLIQVARPGYAPVLACAECRQAARCTHCAGPLGVRRAGETPRCGWCAALAQNWRCSNCNAALFRLVGKGAGRTAEELEKAFPGVRVLVSDGETIRQSVDSRPAIVVATRGAEPLAAGGYAAVILLDGEGMLSRESLRAGEEALRIWSNAVALASPGAPCVLVGVSGPLGNAVAHWDHASFVAAELADRRLLRFPPAVRIATVTGPRAAVEQAVASVIQPPVVDALGPTAEADGSVRSIVRFDYRHGDEVASGLRSQLIQAAIKNRRPRKAGAVGAPAVPLLRLRFDDADIR